jgi:hypothetical protein
VRVPFQHEPQLVEEGDPALGDVVVIGRPFAVRVRLGADDADQGAAVNFLERALDLQDRIRVLDGLYVALAEERERPLLTTDKRLASAGAPCEVILAGGSGTSTH